MQQSALPTPSPSSPSFAGLLAALTAPAEKPAPAWNDDGLQDDVATLSYEHALRAHSRIRPPDADAAARSQSAGPRQISLQATMLDEALHAASPVPAGAIPASSRPPHPLPAMNLKCTSVTIRLSHTECAQLRSRAQESGLTLSAYLRSCTLEAESLRAQVKEALAMLQSAPAGTKPAPPVAPNRSRFGWLRRLWTREPGKREAVRG